MLHENVPIIIDGVITSDMAGQDALVRSVMISLFTWRRANKDDAHEGQKMGWFGDATTDDADKIGSRLWLLARAKITQTTIAKAREYALESLQWLIKDGVASRVEVDSERMGIDGLALTVRIYRTDGTMVDLRFSDIWRAANVQ